MTPDPAAPSPPSAAIQRYFFDWQQPFLAQVASPDVLKRLFCDQAGQLDAGGWVCVLPTAQSVARFRQLLQQWGQSQAQAVPLPKVISVGEAAEQFYQSQQVMANEFEQTIAWATVLAKRDHETIRPLVPTPNESEGFVFWLELAGRLRSLSTELAAHSVSFQKVLSQTQRPIDQARWKLLAQLHDEYLEHLQVAGLADTHQERARAVDQGRLLNGKRLLLIGTSDLNPSAANVIKKAAKDSGNRIVALIAAPPERANDFDEVGRFRTTAVLSRDVPWKDDQLISAGDLRDQCQRLAATVSDWNQTLRPEQICVGTTDGSQVSPLAFALRTAGFSVYRSQGYSVANSGLMKLLDCVMQHLQRPSWRSLAALVRHQDVYRLLVATLQVRDVQQEPLQAIDRLIANHFPSSLQTELPDRVATASQTALMIRDLVQRLLMPLYQDGLLDVPIADCESSDEQMASDQTESALLVQFLGDASSSRVDQMTEDSIRAVTAPLTTWCQRLHGWLQAIEQADQVQIAGQEDVDAESLNRIARRQACELLQRMATISCGLDVEMDALTALQTLKMRLSALHVHQQPQADQLHLRGWLDLALNDSPAMIVLGLNHPYVPSAVGSDSLLPESLRTQLQINDNDRRMARDQLAIEMMIQSRSLTPSEGQMRFIVGRTDAGGSPIPPSRLLAAAPAKDVARRLQLLTGELKSTPFDSGWKALPKSQLPLPPVDQSLDVPPVSVTAFSTYLQCPYRFYLRHVRKLRPLDDDAPELAANQFGDLVHGALEFFGESKVKGLTDPDDIFLALKQHLCVYVDKTFGKPLSQALTLQIQQAEKRLRFVADQQAERIAQGWQIHQVEASVGLSQPAYLSVDDIKLAIRGRFDRIDYHPQLDRWAVLDYKTHGHKPEKKHFRRNRSSGETKWLDLQLPLYRMMIPHLGIDAPPDQVDLGYFNVSDKASETGIHLADFDEDLMRQAEEVIYQCVRGIVAKEFQPTSDVVQYDDYQMILQTGTAARMLAGSLDDVEVTQ